MSVLRFVIVAGSLGLVATSGGAAAEERKHVWADTAELSYVLTAGNAQSNSLGARNVLSRTWDKAKLQFDLGGIRVSTTDITRRAYRDPSNGVLRPFATRDTKLSAEKYWLNGKYDRKISDRFYWNVGAGWERNRFAGVLNRWFAGGGVGNVWLDIDEAKFKTEYGLAGTRDEFSEVDDSKNYLALRLAWDFLWKFSATAKYQNVLIVDDDLGDLPDWRADVTQSLAVAITKKLELKAALQFLYDNRPALKAVDVEYPVGVKTGEKVDLPLQKADLLFTTALVVNF